MRAMTKSLFSASWAMSLFGIKQMMNLVGSSESGQAKNAFDAATQATGEELGDITHSLFSMGDDLQREIVDLISSSMTVNALNPTHMMELPLIQRSADTLRPFLSVKNSQLLVQEFRNKMKVFGLVQQVTSMLELPEKPPYPPLMESVERAMEQEEHPRLWVIEGLGHYHGDTFWKRNIAPRNILTGEEYRDLPAPALTMLHAGIGMAFAQQLFKTVNHLSPAPVVRQMLKEFILLCKENSQPGYEGAALESLGLIARHGEFYGDMRPDKMVKIVSDELAQIDPAVYGYFWHGVGRGIYFLPINFIPGYGSISHAADMIRQIAPDDDARRNALSGLAWGVTMVNILNPEIMENWLTLQREKLAEDDALSNGVMSSIMMRYDTTPDAPFIKEYYEHTPTSSDILPFWHSYVKEACEIVLQEDYPVLAAHGRLGEIFRYRSLSDLVDELKATNKEG